MIPFSFLQSAIKMFDEVRAKRAFTCFLYLLTYIL